jgi:glycopeptide antibiotics resistance protein
MTKTKLRLLTLLWALCIMTAAIIRGYRMGAKLQTTGFAHAALHFGVFMILGFLLMLSYERSSIQLLAVLSGVVLGLGTELYEHVAFQSSMEYGDVFIDGLGVLVGAAARLVRRPSMR